DLAAYIPRIIQIESGGNPNAQTGSYTGLLQMGPDERAKYGGDDLNAGLALLRDRATQFEKQFGRAPTPTEFYLAHQQGMGGIANHMANPDVPAWQNMASTGEGRQKGENWAKQAIWGNVPTDVRAQFPGGVDNLTSRQFMDLWRAKVERGQTAPPPPNPNAPLGANTVAQAKPPSLPLFSPAPYSQSQLPASGVAGGGGGGDDYASLIATASPEQQQAPGFLPPWRPNARVAAMMQRYPFLRRG
ncbi:MAG TPA: hypothetical protein VGQ99_12825, partial [Tepidisphaeraceae bacterium]|nr:hypothetical protein [Tepidisphaeraceae bacterium]